MATLRLSDDQSSNNKFVSLKSAATNSDNFSIEFPASVGTTGKVLKSTVSGSVATLSWQTDSATDSSKLPLTGGSLSGDLVLENQKDVRFSEATAGGSNYAALQAPAAIGSNYTMVLPADVGATGKVLKSTVSSDVATLTWETDSATDNTKLPLDGSGVMTGDLKFEGSSADDYETIVTPTNATGSDKTITLPNATGTVSLLDNTETLTNKTLTSPAVAAPTVTGIADLTGAVLAGASPLVFEGATADAYELTLAVTDVAGSDKTITLPNATGTVSLLTATETLTNKTLTTPTITTPVITGLDLAGCLREGAKVTAGKLSDNANINLADGMVHLFTVAETTTSTPNLRVDSSTTLNSVMAVGEAISVTIITTAATAGFSALLTIDGSSVTANWVGGSAPDAGGGSGVDIYTYNIIKTAATPSYTVIANLTVTSS